MPRLRFQSALCAALALTMCAVIFAACVTTNTYRSFGKSFPRVEITKSDDLFADYPLTKHDADKKALLDNGISDADLTDILQRSKEGAMWPDSLRSLEARNRHRVDIAHYRAYQVATFGNKCLLVIPAKLNKHLPKGIAPKETFYMIFAAKSIAPAQQ